MPVVTRSQKRRTEMSECTRRFEYTVANPCVLQLIVDNLSEQDIVALKQVSKDIQFNDVIDHNLKRMLYRKQRINKCIKKVKNYLDHVSSLYHKQDKLVIVNKMFQYLCANKWFVEHHPGFSYQVHSKLFETILDHPVFIKNGVKYLGKLYGLMPPKYYYNSKLGLSKYGMFDKDNNFIELSK